MADENEKLSISGLACVSVGVDKITSFSDGTAQAKFLAEAYEPLLSSELSLYKWRFATEYFDLKPNKLASIPLGKHDTEYQLPTAPKVVSVDTVLVSDLPINYERSGQKIMTTGTGDDNVILKYRFRAQETEWYPYFRQLMVYRLATGIAFSVMRNTALAEKMDDIADRHWKRAKTEDAQGQTNQKLRSSGLVRRRNGGVDKFWRRR